MTWALAPLVAPPRHLPRFSFFYFCFSVFFRARVLSGFVWFPAAPPLPSLDVFRGCHCPGTRFPPCPPRFFVFHCFFAVRCRLSPPGAPPPPLPPSAFGGCRCPAACLFSLPLCFSCFFPFLLLPRVLALRRQFSPPAPPPPGLRFAGVVALPRVFPCSLSPLWLVHGCWPLVGGRCCLLPPPPPLVCVSRVSSPCCSSFLVLSGRFCFCAPLGRSLAVLAACFPPPPPVVCVSCLLLSGGAALCRSEWCFAVPCCSILRCGICGVACPVVVCRFLSCSECCVVPHCVVCMVPRCFSSCGCALLSGVQCSVALCGVVVRRDFCCGAASCCCVLCVLCCAVPPCAVVSCCVLCGVLWRCVEMWHVTSCGVALYSVAVCGWLCASLCCAVLFCAAVCCAVCLVVCCFALDCVTVCFAVPLGAVLRRVASRCCVRCSAVELFGFAWCYAALSRAAWALRGCAVPSGVVQCRGAVCYWMRCFAFSLCAVCAVLCVFCRGVLVCGVVCCWALCCVCPVVSRCVFPIFPAISKTKIKFFTKENLRHYPTHARRRALCCLRCLVVWCIAVSCAVMVSSGSSAASARTRNRTAICEYI